MAVKKKGRKAKVILIAPYLKGGKKRSRTSSKKRSRATPTKKSELKTPTLTNVWLVSARVSVNNENQNVGLLILTEAIEDAISRAYEIGAMNGWVNPVVMSAVFQGIANQ